jgi:hypothetical protein
VTARFISECGLCHGTDLQPVLSLGTSPVTGTTPGQQATVEHYPLELVRCDACTLVQLSAIVDPVVSFPPGYAYSSGNSRALHANFEQLAVEATEVWPDPNHLVVDIGANDGTLLRKFGCRTVGVEPTGQAERITGPKYQEFFTSKLATRIREEHGPANVVTACNVLAHVEDITDVLHGIYLLLGERGVLVAENHDLATVVNGGQWDTVYHEHLRYYTPHSFHLLLRRHGLMGLRSKPIASHGGSFRTTATRTPSGPGLAAPKHPIPTDLNYDFARLRLDAAEARRRVRDMTAGGGVWAAGATARATTIVTFCGLDVEDIVCVCEVAGSDKIGSCIPGTRIPVIDEAALFEEQPPMVLLFSWHLEGPITAALRDRGYEGKIVVPPLGAWGWVASEGISRTPQVH